MVTIWARPSGCVLSFSSCTVQPVTACAFYFCPPPKKSIFSRSAAFLFYT
nr:MAG TPA: hypothetical protein [Caudoviricetes sp.]